MKTIVLDSYAVLAYFEKQPGWEEVAGLLAEAIGEDVRLCLSVVNWGEVVYITQRVYGDEKASEVVQAIDELSIEVVEATRAVTAQAARLKARGGLAYADCFAAGLAVLWQGEVLTGDPEFEQVAADVPIRWLPRRNA